MKHVSRTCILAITMFAAGSATAGATFYESENFGGRQMSGNQSMPNFRTLDFNDRARSAIIEGGPWEVCVGTNFGNDCTVFPAGRYPTLGEWSRKISSARPVGAGPAAAMPPNGGITFYETENFGGRQITADRSLPSFGTVGFAGRAQSAIVDGGHWEVCGDYNFAGGCTVLAPGRYPTLGTWSGRISSTRPATTPVAAFPPSGGITFYETENFGGRQLAINQPVANFDGMGFNDRAYSAIVDGSAWEICVDADFHGDCRMFVPGRYPALGGLGGRVSSARPSYDAPAEPPRERMRSRVDVTLFSEPNLIGRAYRLGPEGQDNLYGVFNDRASSLRVDRGYWIFCSDANFQGECRTFGPGEYPILPPELNQRISSGRRISNDYPYSQNPNWR
ncbi:MAG: beta/gamma crystallin-related protein [Betaproteobacteria bacterium]